jgi:hypothetical protein
MSPPLWSVASALCLLSAFLVSGEDLPHPAPVIGFEMPSEVDAPVDPDATRLRSLMTIPGVRSSP